MTRQGAAVGIVVPFAFSLLGVFASSWWEASAGETVATPTVSPGFSTFYDVPFKVTISCSTSNVTIYYTTDTTSPSKSGIRYTGPVLLTKTTQLKAQAFKNGVYGPTCSGTYTLGSKKGWSKDTGFRDADTSVRKALAKIARNVRTGASSGASVVNDGVWYTDVSNGDDARIAAAFTEYAGWRAKNPKATVPQSETDKVVALLTSYKSSDGKYDVRGTFAKQIEAVYDQTKVAPSKPQDILTTLSIRKQCFEWAMTQVIASSGAVRHYDDAGVTDFSAWRPGMGVFFYSSATLTSKYSEHTALIADIYWDDSGNPTKFQLGEANHDANVWYNPFGQLPWARTTDSRIIDVTTTMSSKNYIKVVKFD